MGTRYSFLPATGCKILMEIFVRTDYCILTDTLKMLTLQGTETDEFVTAGHHLCSTLCLYHCCYSQEALYINCNKLASIIFAAAAYLPIFYNGICSSDYYTICILSAFNKIYLSWVKKFDWMTADKLLIIILFCIRRIYQNHMFLYWPLSWIGRCLAQQRKTEVDESSDESKRQKTEDAASSDALSGEISVTENSGENKNKDELETRSEVNEIHSTPGNDTPDISAEDQVKSCVEEPAIEMERKEDDSSENKENVIDETISNGATEKTAELAEEEPTKV